MQFLNYFRKINSLLSFVGFSLFFQLAFSQQKNLYHAPPSNAIKGKDLIKINDEVMKVDLVGIGSTNSLNVIRGVMGTCLLYTSDAADE